MEARAEEEGRSPEELRVEARAEEDAVRGRMESWTRDGGGEPKEEEADDRTIDRSKDGHIRSVSEAAASPE